MNGHNITFFLASHGCVSGWTVLYFVKSAPEAFYIIPLLSSIGLIGMVIQWIAENWN